MCAMRRVANRAAINGNDFIDWGMISPEPGKAFTTNGGVSFEIVDMPSGAGSQVYLRQQQNLIAVGPFNGCFNTGDWLLQGQKPTIPLKLKFLGGAVCKAAGAELEPISFPNPLPRYFGYLMVFDAADLPVNIGNGAVVTRLLNHGKTNGAAGDIPKATFLGVESDEGFAAIEFYIEQRRPNAFPKSENLACNRIELRF